MAALIRSGYALCTAPRSGSNWVGQLLESTGVLGRPLEYFNAIGRRRADPAYPADPAEQIERVLADGATPNGVYAVKVFPAQIDSFADQLRWTLVLPRLRFVHLRRRDLLGQAISLHRARRTNQYRATWEAEGEAAYDGALILTALHDIVRQHARWDAFFGRNGVEPVRLAYEEAVEQPQSAADAVADLLGLAVRPRIDLSRVDLTVQRDDVTVAWRARFHAEFGDLDRVDTV